MKETFEIRDMRNGEWYWSYNAILSDPHLTPSDKLAYDSLATFGGCNVIRPSVEVIAERACLNIRTTMRGLKKLEEVGYIKVDKGGGRHKTNIYYLLKMKKGCKKCQGLETVTKNKGNSDICDTKTVTKTTPQVDKELDKKEDSLAVQSTAGKTLNLLIEKFKEVNPSYETLFPNKNQRAALERLVVKHGQEKVERLIQWISRTNKMPYSPTITTPVELEVKLGQLLAFISKEKLKADKGKISVSIRTTKDGN